MGASCMRPCDHSSWDERRDGRMSQVAEAAATDAVRRMRTLEQRTLEAEQARARIHPPLALNPTLLNLNPPPPWP
eukprot:5459179-Pyramimonas_sp.AAC.1